MLQSKSLLKYERNGRSATGEDKAKFNELGKVIEERRKFCGEVNDTLPRPSRFD